MSSVDSPPHAGPAVVLLVEDDPGDADLLSLALRRSGLKTTLVWCSSGPEALDALTGRGRYAADPPPRPAVILMDLKMPGMNGIEAARAVRGEAALNGVPVVMFTSSRDPGDVAQAYAAGASSYVVKPVHSGQYTDAVATLARYWVGYNLTR